MSLEDGIKSFKALEEEAKNGHFGNCTLDAECCQACMVEDAFRRGKDVANAWEYRKAIK